jgi:2-deoxy-D-gluconate 3-dehydrogenase
MQVNLHVPFYLSKIASQHFLKQKRGKIVNIISVLAFQGGDLVPAYIASKHGLLGLTRSFASGLAKHGVNVNAIAAGWMATDMTTVVQENQSFNEYILRRTPTGRWGQRDDLKGTLLFLSSSLSDHVNGAAIPVDGGWLSH